MAWLLSFRKTVLSLNASADRDPTAPVMDSLWHVIVHGGSLFFMVQTHECAVCASSSSSSQPRLLSTARCQCTHRFFLSPASNFGIKFV